MGKGAKKNMEKDAKKDTGGQEESAWTLCLSSDWDIYGGKRSAGKERGRIFSAKDGKLTVDLPAFGALYLMKGSGR